MFPYRYTVGYTEGTPSNSHKANSGFAVVTALVVTARPITRNTSDYLCAELAWSG